MDKQDWLHDLFIEEAQVVLPPKPVPATGWSANKLLGTDEDGNVVEKDSTGGGFTEDSSGEIILPAFDIDSTLTMEGAAADAKATGDRLLNLENYITPQMYGAIGNGITDDTTAIQAMFNDAAGVTKVYFPTGEYVTTAPIVVEQVPDVEMDGVILSNHNGVGLDLGTNTSTIIDKTIKIKIKKKGTKYEAGSVGLLLHSAARNTFYLDTVNNFETNVKLLSVDKGIWFNTFHLNNLNYAKYGLYLDGSNNGWINDNLFIGGSISVDSDSTGITINHGSSNVFLKQGLEGAGTCVHIISGGTNSFLQARCEDATYGLVVDDGGNNVIQSNYALPEFVNNSPFATNGVIQSGIHNICKHQAVAVDRLEDNRFLICDIKVVPTYCKAINSITGKMFDVFNLDGLKYENGVWMAGNYAPVFVFDTTKNKRFEFGGHPTVQVNVYDSNGRVTLTEENVSQYVLVDRAVVPSVNSNYGNGARLGGSTFLGFEVSEEVVQIELVYIGSDYNSNGITYFDIRTEYPCYPIRDEVLTVPSLPENGYVGARILYNEILHIYNGKEWMSISNPT